AAKQRRELGIGLIAPISPIGGGFGSGNDHETYERDETWLRGLMGEFFKPQMDGIFRFLASDRRPLFFDLCLSYLSVVHF
ncbi:MAG: hypothetical protein QNL77_03385, partial [Akkermansiaceae bacterium]